MMRVLHVYKTYGADGCGGVERCISQLLHTGPAAGYDGEVLTTGPRDHVAQVDGSTVHTVRRQLTIASTPMATGVITRLRELAPRFDLIHYHFPWPWMDLAHLVGRIDRPSVVTYHADVVRQASLMTLYRPLMRRFLGAVDRIIATSPDYLASSPVLARFQDKCEVIPIGLDRANYPVPDTATLDAWRARVGQGFFLFVGVLRYYKGLHVLIEAARRTGLPVVVVGDGPLGDELKAQALGLPEWYWLGTLPEIDKAALLSLCGAFVFPSQLRAEAFGISLLEAAMFGKPMISCAIGTGTSYVNVNGETGIVVAPDNPAALATAMTTLAADDALRSRLGQQARARFEQLFQARDAAARHAALYQRIAVSAQTRTGLV